MFASSSVASVESKWKAEYQRVINSLKTNFDLVIPRPDKGACVVILDRADCAVI